MQEVGGGDVAEGGGSGNEDRHDLFASGLEDQLKTGNIAAEQVKMVQGIIDKKLNRRNTKQRQLILKIIERADGHLDADQIYERVRQLLPGISLSTVYRNLQLFRNVGLLAEHQFSGMRRRYEIATRSRHHHLMCIGCGRIFEFSCPSSDGLQTRITREKGFRVTDAEVRLVGYCPECQRWLAKNNENAKLERR